MGAPARRQLAVAAAGSWDGTGMIGRARFRDVLASIEARWREDPATGLEPGLPFTFALDPGGREMREQAWARCPECGDPRLCIEDDGRGRAFVDCRSRGCRP